MAVLARVRWSSPGPRVVDEELIISGDGEALLVVRTSRDGSPAIGTWRTPVGADDRAALAGHWIARSICDVRCWTRSPRWPSGSPPRPGTSPWRPRPSTRRWFRRPAVAEVALQAVGGGIVAGRVRARPGLGDHPPGGRRRPEVGWRPAERLEAGFVSPEPEGLGGVGRPAEIAPGTYGTIALGCPALDADVDGAEQVAVEVAGRLRESVTEDGYARRFSVRTASAPIPR